MLKIQRDAESLTSTAVGSKLGGITRFDTYHDPEYVRFGDLRVFNDDPLVPGAVWPMHPHRDIEGITYVVEGTFEHDDRRGNGGTLPPDRFSG